MAIPLTLFKILGFLGFLVTAFYWLWGFNYQQKNVNEAFGFKLEGLAKDQIDQEFYWVNHFIDSLNRDVNIESWRASGFIFDNEMELKIREAVNQLLIEEDIGIQANVPLTFIKPDGVLLRISTAGFYWPLSGEAHVDGGLYPLQWPYTVAHELFHGHGITDEGDCNFLALLACLKTNDPRLSYSAILGYWRYVASEFRRHNGRDGYKNKFDELPTPFKQDLKNVYEYLERYPDIFPKLRNKIYNSYLKSQGVKEGMKSYNKVVMLFHGWRKLNRLKNSD